MERESRKETKIEEESETKELEFGEKLSYPASDALSFKYLSNRFVDEFPSESVRLLAADNPRRSSSSSVPW